MAKKSGCMGFNILNLALAAGLLVVIFGSVFYGTSKTTKEGVLQIKRICISSYEWLRSL